MKEEILYYIWQHQSYDYSHLQTVHGQDLLISSLGIPNTNAGPDFSLARLFIDGIEWWGAVEMHIRASDWYRHQHHNDPAYNKVILHVVWQYDQEVYRNDGTVVPTLELRKRVNPHFLRRIQTFLVTETTSLPCATMIQQVPSLLKISQLEYASAQRLERKSSEVLQLLEKNRGNWEETAYQWLLRCFGFQVNNEPMQQLAMALPLFKLKKHYANGYPIEAILLTRAGLAKYVNPQCDLPAALLKQLKDDQLPKVSWRYSRMRPPNFPHVRIRQLASLLVKWNVELGWLYHPSPAEEYYAKFELEDQAGPSGMGSISVLGIIINAIVPLLTAYGRYHRNNEYQQHAWNLLECLPPEKNQVVRKYSELSFPRSSALDTQGILEQQNFCSRKACLSCRIGSSIMKNHYLFVS